MALTSENRIYSPVVVDRSSCLRRTIIHFFNQRNHYDIIIMLYTSTIGNHNTCNHFQTDTSSNVFVMAFAEKEGENSFITEFHLVKVNGNWLIRATILFATNPSNHFLFHVHNVHR